MALLFNDTSVDPGNGFKYFGLLYFINIILLKKLKSTCLKWTYEHSGNDYRVALLSKSYLTTTEITMQSLKSMGQF